MATARAQLGRVMRLDDSMAIETYIYTSTLTPATLATLRQHGVRVLRSDAQFAMAYATVPLRALADVATLPAVRWIAKPAYSMQRTGSVTSEGDTVMRADLARMMPGVTGNGVKVGIISDSLCDAATSSNSGDLPPLSLSSMARMAARIRAPTMRVGHSQKSSMTWRQGPPCSSAPAFPPVWISLLLSKNSRRLGRRSSWMTSNLPQNRFLKRDQSPRRYARPFSRVWCS